MATIDMADYLTTEQAAAVLELSEDTVRRYCNHREPKLKGRKIGRDWLIHKKEIERFNKARKPPGRPSTAA